MGKMKPGCPICRNPETTSYKPFCSKRCADLDLGAWLGEGYQLPGQQMAEPEELIAAARENGLLEE